MVDNPKSEGLYIRKKDIIFVAVIIFLLAVIIVQWNNSVSFEEYEGCVMNLTDNAIAYGDLTLDYLNLLNCYQRDMPTCDILGSKEGYSPAVFRQYDCSSCEGGWCVVPGTDSCCPNPNMKIVNDKCVANTN